MILPHVGDVIEPLNVPSPWNLRVKVKPHSLDAAKNLVRSGRWRVVDLLTSPKPRGKRSNK